MRRRAAVLVSAGLAAAALWSGGCAGSRAATNRVQVEQAGYATAFNAAIEKLRELGFQPDRIDARAGIVTSEPLGSAGLLTPWDRTQGSLGDELGDAVHRQRRVVRIEFVPVNDAEPDPQSPLVTSPGSQAGPVSIPAPVGESRALSARVRVTIERVERANEQLDPSSIRLSTRGRDDQLAARRMWPTYSVARQRDVDLEREIAGAIQDALARTD